MEIAEHIDALRREGELFADAATVASPDVPVPTCPEWVTRDLVHHIGGVHRWATRHVTEAHRDVIDDDLLDLVGGWPDDDQLLAWFRAGHAALVAALAEAPDDLECFTFLRAPSARAFWARRQAHETAIHRIDAEAAAGRPFTPVDPAFAADGIDELACGFVPRRSSRLRSDEPRRLAICAEDTGDDWLVRISADPPETTRESGPADGTVRGAANDLYVLLWNRPPADGIAIEGDRSVLDLWRSLVHVRWS